jgi:putative cell wall-binding protein
MVAEDAWPDGAPTVLLANGYRYADALTGAPLATALNAPILLTGGEELAARAREALVTLGARTVIVLGGTAAVSAATADAVAVLPGVTRVDRIAGTDRFDTAVRIGQRIGGDAVYVTEGANADPARGWPDSLAAASLAAAQGRAIVLVTRDALPSTARDFLATKDAATIVGGTAAVSTEVEEAMDRVVGVVDRVAGNTRYTTALAVAREAQVGGADGRRTYLATGSAFADALAAGPAVARTGGVLMLVDGQRYAGAPATAAYLRETAVDQLVALGGEQAITAATLARATEDARAGRQEAP